MIRIRIIHFSCPATSVSNQTEVDLKNKDWVFVNYTYKRFEGLTARGAIPSYMKSAKRWADCSSSITWTRLFPPPLWKHQGSYRNCCHLLSDAWDWSFWFSPHSNIIHCRLFAFFLWEFPDTSFYIPSPAPHCWTNQGLPWTLPQIAKGTSGNPQSILLLALTAPPKCCSFNQRLWAAQIRFLLKRLC